MAIFSCRHLISGHWWRERYASTDSEFKSYVEQCYVIDWKWIAKNMTHFWISSRCFLRHFCMNSSLFTMEKRKYHDFSYNENFIASFNAAIKNCAVPNGRWRPNLQSDAMAPIHSVAVQLKTIRNSSVSWLLLVITENFASEKNAVLLFWLLIRFELISIDFKNVWKRSIANFPVAWVSFTVNPSKCMESAIIIVISIIKRIHRQRRIDENMIKN